MSACLGFYLRSFHICSLNPQQLYAPPRDIGNFLSPTCGKYKLQKSEGMEKKKKTNGPNKWVKLKCSGLKTK